MVSIPRFTGRSVMVQASDGYVLGVTAFEPHRPRATVVIHGATATRQTYYARFAEYLASRGLRVVTYDYRGIGASAPESLRGFEASMTDWATLDARAVHEWATSLGQDVLYVGHSFGGQMLGLVDELRSVKAAVLVGAQLGWYRMWPALQSARHALSWYVLVPLITSAAGYLPGRAGLGVDLPSGVAREWARWCTHPDYLVGHHPDAAARFARWDRPTLLLSSPADTFAPPDAVDALRRRLSSAPLEHRTIPDLDHFDFFRPQANGLWRDIVDFLLTPRPYVAPMFTLEEIMDDLEFGR
jgi:predicted alpha/beta hydrolase